MLKAKWKNIRDSYRKCLNKRQQLMRSGSANYDKKIQECKFFKELSFLHVVVTSHPTTSNLPSTTQENNKENEKYHEEESSAECSFTEQPAKKRLKTIVSKEYYKTSVVTHIVMSRLDSNSPFRFIYWWMISTTAYYLK